MFNRLLVTSRAVMAKSSSRVDPQRDNTRIQSPVQKNDRVRFKCQSKTKPTLARDSDPVNIFVHILYTKIKTRIDEKFTTQSIALTYC